MRVKAVAGLVLGRRKGTVWEADADDPLVARELERGHLAPVDDPDEPPVDADEASKPARRGRKEG